MRGAGEIRTERSKHKTASPAPKPLDWEQKVNMMAGIVFLGG
jgi:hypothetical protein